MWKRFYEKNPTIPEPLGLDEDETLMTSLLFLMTLHFRAGLVLSRNIYRRLSLSQSPGDQTKCFELSVV